VKICFFTTSEMTKSLTISYDVLTFFASSKSTDISSSGKYLVITVPYFYEIFSLACLPFHLPCSTVHVPMLSTDTLVSALYNDL
jgi:hypothetical protein